MLRDGAPALPCLRTNVRFTCLTLCVETVEVLVEPLLGGVYAGHAREISARAAVPQVVALLDQDKSLSKAAATALGPV